MISKLLLWFAPGTLFQEITHVGAGVPAALEAYLGEAQAAIAKAQATGEPQLLELTRIRFEYRARYGDVAHYELVSRPPDGKRWILAKPGRIIQEPIK